MENQLIFSPALMFDVEDFAAGFARQSRAIGKTADGPALVAFMREMFCSDANAMQTMRRFRFDEYDDAYVEDPTRPAQGPDIVASFVYSMMRSILEPIVPHGTPAMVVQYDHTGAVIARKRVRPGAAKKMKKAKAKAKAKK